jgi:hypothetical protein
MDRLGVAVFVGLLFIASRDFEDKKAEGKDRKEVVKEERKSAVSPESPARFLLPMLLPLFPES